MITEKNRQSFEAWIAAPPYERLIGRVPQDESKYAWPGQYVDIAVELAWEAWCEAASASQNLLANPGQ